MEPEGLGFLSGLVTALGGLVGATDTAPQPGGAVIELRVSGQEFIVPPEHILAVLASVNDITQMPQLELSFDASGATLFAEITAAHIGQEMDLVVCDQVLMSPVIQEPITGGQIVITGNFTVDETTLLASQISGSTPCDTSEATK
ncbi:hypothetical protein [Nioella sp. MMSF_3534]|uniref:SecDF P1 head subdomain-containing protein n=1 Tax=Nioella sp. MMSF_3534 TaxID=3046720 RepID=UPI00273F9DAC|nr:hypothetical protein [Nioella sp. MMSF_3534]